MNGGSLLEVFRLMLEAPDRCRSLDAVLLASLDEPGALEVDLWRWAEKRRRTPEELLERPPERSNWGGEWQFEVRMRDRELEAFPVPSPWSRTPAILMPAWSGDVPCAVQLMLSPHMLVADFQFDPSVDSADSAGRRCHLLHGWPRPTALSRRLGSRLWSSRGLSVAIDAELGIARALTAGAAAPWCRIELRDVASSAPGREWRSGAETEILEGLHLAEAAALTRFPLHLPGRVPAGAEMVIDVASTGEWAFVSFAQPDSRWPVLMEERPSAGPIGELLDAWDRLDGGNRPMWIWDRTRDHAEPGHRWLVIQTGGTRISVYSRLPRALLLAVAASLEPAG